MSPTLVLNFDYLPLGYTTFARAVRLVLDGRAEIRLGEGIVRSVGLTLRAPKVIRLFKFVRLRRTRVPLTKRNVVLRDRETCQYCGYTGTRLTIDHVLPRSRAGRDVWENLVCACMRCNNSKGDRTPREAGMTLRRVPREPHPTTFMRASLRDASLDPFLFGETFGDDVGAIETVPA